MLNPLALVAALDDEELEELELLDETEEDELLESTPLLDSVSVVEVGAAGLGAGAGAGAS